MEKYFAERILGQEDVINSLMNTITTFKARLTDINKPIRSYLFVGPTGVGKTESAKVLAGYLFNNQEKIIRLNMSEYNDYHSVSKLIGSHLGDLPKSSKFHTFKKNSPQKQPFTSTKNIFRHKVSKNKKVP